MCCAPKLAQIRVVRRVIVFRRVRVGVRRGLVPERGVAAFGCARLQSGPLAEGAVAVTAQEQPFPRPAGLFEAALAATRTRYSAPRWKCTLASGINAFACSGVTIGAIAIRRPIDPWVRSRGAWELAHSQDGGDSNSPRHSRGSGSGIGDEPKETTTGVVARARAMRWRICRAWDRAKASTRVVASRVASSVGTASTGRDWESAIGCLFVYSAEGRKNLPQASQPYLPVAGRPLPDARARPVQVGGPFLPPLSGLF